ncbi:hypothetical protein BJY01DRAFT_157270 [Aspergillus pseudoustus]|uniref:Uncharacterized protein n=1 Tax=Aspergillus pseudoustus TaxID=1810923 RepID=A0ABR4KAZ9_9EURO
MPLRHQGSLDCCSLMTPDLYRDVQSPGQRVLSMHGGIIIWAFHLALFFCRMRSTNLYLIFLLRMQAREAPTVCPAQKHQRLRRWHYELMNYITNISITPSL